MNLTTTTTSANQNYLKACGLRRQDRATPNGADLNARHRTTDVKIIVVGTGRLHHCHALRTAYVLGWILQHGTNHQVLLTLSLSLSNKQRLT